MTKKLLLAAFITTPLIVANSVLPLYFQGEADIRQAINIAVIIGSNAFFIWFINIGLVTKVSISKGWQLYGISYLSVIIVSIPFRAAAINYFPATANSLVSPAFPAINAMVFNTIVWAIIEFIRSSEQHREAQATIDKLKIENLEAQKQSLTRQIQPHFIFNALSTLKSLIAESPKDAEAYTIKLSNFMRYSFSSETVDLTALKQELDFVQNYIELQSIRFEGAFTYEITIPEDALTYKVPIFALQTLVENIFKHNYFSESKPLQFTIKHEDTTLVVWNEKTGLKLTERNETGLVNLNKRYELTNGTGITILDKEHEFSVTIPLIAP